MKNIIILVACLILLFSCSSSKSGANLIEAMKMSDFEKIKKIADSKNVNETDDMGATPLMWASFNGNVKVMEYLLSKGADCKKKGLINYKDSRFVYSSPLNAAAGEGHLEAIKYLIERCNISINDRGLEINDYTIYPKDIIDVRGLYNFMSQSDDIVSKGILELVKKVKITQIIKEDPNFATDFFILQINRILLNWDIYPISPKIEEAVLFQKNNSSILNKIRNNREYVDSVFKGYVLKKNTYEFVIGVDGETALMAAVGSEKIDMVKYLLSKGADPNISTKFYSPLLSAAMKSNFEVAKLLIESGADSKTIDQFGNSVPYYFFYFDPEKKDIISKLKSITASLLKTGADINHQNLEGETVLQKMCKEKHAELVEFLVSVGADPDIEVDGKKIREICKENGIEIKDEWFKKKTE